MCVPLPCQAEHVTLRCKRAWLRRIKGKAQRYMVGQSNKPVLQATLVSAQGATSYWIIQMLALRPSNPTKDWDSLYAVETLWTLLRPVLLVFGFPTPPCVLCASSKASMFETEGQPTADLRKNVN